MVWWQGVLIFLWSVAAGSIVGLLLAYVILRIQKRPWPFSRARKGRTVAREQIKSAGQARGVGVESRGAILDLLSTHVIPQIQRIPWTFFRARMSLTAGQAPIKSADQVRDAEAPSSRETQEATVVEEKAGAITQAYDDDTESIGEKREVEVQGGRQTNSSMPSLFRDVETE